VNITQSALDEAETTLRQTTVALQVGHRPEFDVLRARVARDSERPILIQQRAVRDIAYVRLKQLLQLPVDQRITLTTTLDDGAATPAGAEVTATTPPQAATSAPGQVYGRAPVREAREAVLAQQNLLQAVQAQRYPGVAFASQYQRLAYPTSLLRSPDQYLTNWTAGVSAQVPIFTGGQIRGAEAVARANLDEARLRLSQAIKLADLDTRDAITRLDAAEATWSASSGTVVQAARAYQIASVRFREGVSTQIELVDSQLLLQQAEADRVMAARDLQLARLRVEFLHDLPLNTGATTPAMPIAPSTPRQNVQPQPTRPTAPGPANPTQPQPLNASGQPLIWPLR
jgi:outer membrane protein TolC